MFLNHLEASLEMKIKYSIKTILPVISTFSNNIYLHNIADKFWIEQILFRFFRSVTFCPATDGGKVCLKLTQSCNDKRTQFFTYLCEILELLLTPDTQHQPLLEMSQ